MLSFIKVTWSARRGTPPPIALCVCDFAVVCVWVWVCVGGGVVVVVVVVGGAINASNWFD